MKFEKHILPSGLRAILIPSKNTETVTVLVLVGAGSKYEQKKKSGISHFLEHMCFKGTKKRSNYKAVAETLDKIGGAYNAFTGDEYTGYYAKVSKNHFDVALDWASDIFLNSTLPTTEIKKEKGVIVEEINMRYDHPMINIRSLWTELLYGDQPAGWDIAGEKETVMNITRKDLIDYKDNHYTATNTIICLSGNIGKDALNKTKKHFARINKNKPREKTPVVENQNKPLILTKNKKTDQTHLCLGVRAYDVFDDRKYALSVLTSVLGKMMSSRMFVKIREELGLAYYVNTETDATTDTGFLVTQAGVVNAKAEKAVKAILDEYKRISLEKVPLEELRKSKENIKGKLALSLESSDARANFYATQELLQGQITTPEEISKKIDEVTSKDVLEVSRDIFRSENLNLALIGPSINNNNFKKILNNYF